MDRQRSAGAPIRQGGSSPTLRERARALRRAHNPAEAALWAILRQRRVHGWKFRRQGVLGPFIADFYCAELRLVVEVDGSVHDEPEVRSHDAARDSWLLERGVRVLRLPSALILRDAQAVVARIEATASERPLGRAGSSASESEDVL